MTARRARWRRRPQRRYRRQKAVFPPAFHRAPRQTQKMSDRWSAAPPRQLLRRHVAWSADNDVGVGECRRWALGADRAAGIAFRQLGQSEVEDLGVAGAGDEDVLGFEVAVDDVVGMGRSEPVGDLGCVLDRLALRHAAAVDSLAKALALEQLGNEERHTSFVADVENGEDVGVVERPRRARFELEAGQSISVCGKGRGQNLNRHVAADPRVSSPIDLAHPTRADLVDDLIVGEVFADHAPSSDIRLPACCPTVSCQEISTINMRCGGVVGNFSPYRKALPCSSTHSRTFSRILSSRGHRWEPLTGRTALLSG